MRLVAAAAAVTLGCALAWVLSACAAPAGGDDDGRPVVLTTFTVTADMARNVSGDLLRVESITRVGSEIHGYEPTPDDLRRASDAELILDNGLGLEAWFAGFVEQLDAPHVTLSDGVETIPIQSGEYEGAANPHAWMSPLAAQVYVENIADAFADLDPDNADAYRANAEAYIDELDAIHDELVTELGSLPANERALVTCEGAFSYLARDTGLTEAYLWPVNSDDQGTPQQIADTVTFVRDQEVPAIFCESTVSDQAQQQVASEAGSEVGGVLYVDSLSEPDGPVPTYLDLLRHDATTISEALRGQG